METAAFWGRTGLPLPMKAVGSAGAESWQARRVPHFGAELSWKENVK